MTDSQHPDDRLDELVRATARDYNRPGPAPREAMWARIEQARREARPAPVAPLHPSRGRGWIWSVVAAAAVLMLGVAIGRYSMTGTGTGARTMTAQRSVPAPIDSAAVDGGTSTPAATPDATPRTEVASAGRPSSTGGRVEGEAGRPRTLEGEGGSANAAPYRLAVAEHLARTEVLLTSFRAEARGGSVDPQIATWARDLLRTTRLLQHAPASTDPGMQRLLDDLELVLVQITQYGGGNRDADELELIEQSMDRRGVMGKLRATLPPGTTPAGT